MPPAEESRRPSGGPSNAGRGPCDPATVAPVASPATVTGTTQTPAEIAPDDTKVASAPRVVRGVLLSSDEVAQFDAISALQDPVAAARRVDEFAKWLFGGTTIVGALLIGLARTGVTPAQSSGQILHAIAVVCLGVSLALASVSLAPKWSGYNRHSPEQRREAVDYALTARRRPLRWATSLFAASLVAAGLAPLGSVYDARWHRHPRVEIAYTLPDSGPLAATLWGVALPEGSIVDFMALAVPRHADGTDSPSNASSVVSAATQRQARRMPRARTVVRADGAANMSLILRSPFDLDVDTLLLVGASEDRTTIVAVPVRQLTRTPSVGARPPR